MIFARSKIKRVLNLCIALCLGVLFAACLDIPSDPDTQGKIVSISVCTMQYGKTDSTLLKVNPKDSALIVTKVNPEKHKRDLKYYWYNNQELLDSGSTFPIIFMVNLLIPNRLVVEDGQGNTIEKNFHIITNAPPVIGSEATPADKETIFGTTETPIRFSWKTGDSNISDELEHILEIDGITYPVGPLTEVLQSGFEPGEHTFRVFVADPYGDSDTLPLRHFYVVDTLEAKK